MNQHSTIDLEHGWNFIQRGITKLKNILEGPPEPRFSSKDYMKLYTRIYNMCSQKPPHDYSQQLYDKYREAFEEYITTTKVQHKLLSVYATQLLEKEHSGFHALLRDDKVEDLSRLYRFFSKIPQGLDPVAIILKQHVTAEGTALVKHAEDAASNKKADKRDVVGLQEQVFVRKVIELHDKYLAYVNNCFQNCTLFHKALKEASELFCEGVAGNSALNFLPHFATKFSKNAEVRNSVMKPLKRHWSRW